MMTLVDVDVVAVKRDVASEIRDQIDQLQTWFAGRPYGWRDRATAQQLQQWADREREYDHLVSRLEMLEGK